ncbi:MAG: M48 family metalloprotease [Steroidobacteraceae bacterium]|jgi:Zn-dependent protease with chaperone function
MERAQFEALIERMEQVAVERPAAYRRRVFGLAALGYGYLFFMVLVLLVLSALSIWSLVYLKGFGVKLVLIVGALLYAVLRSLWVKQDPPAGERVRAVDAPQLFRMLEELKQRLQTPAIHTVLITPEFNAAVSQVPRMGLFGWHRNFLVLGLPLMKALTVEQFKSVLAHELGHLSRGHARAANWIYRMRVIWARLESTFERRPQWGSGAIRRFFKWYIPYFNAVSFPFARANEYEADAASVQLTSARDAAQALTGVHIIGNYFTQKYWPTIHAAAKDSPQPAFAPFSGFVAQAVSKLPKGDLEKWQDAALNQITSHVDTHPSLGDRLKAIGAAAEFAPPRKGEGADQLLGAALEKLEKTFDSQWRDRVSNSWQKYHDQTQTKRARLAALQSEKAAGPLSEHGSVEIATLEEEVGAGSIAALPLLREAVARFPASAIARFALARHLLREGREEGVPVMESVLRDDPTALLAASELMRNYFSQRGDHASAKSWHDRYIDEAVRTQRAQKERQRLLLSDRYAPHELDAGTAAALTLQLKAVKGIKRAYLVRKVDPRFPDKPLYVLGVKSTGFFQLHSQKRATRAVNGIREKVVFPGETIILNVDGNLYKFARKMRRVKRSKLI